MISWLMGRMHVQESAPKSMSFRDDIPDEVELPHEEAIEYLRSRTSMSRDAFYDLEAAGRFRAFTVAKVAGMDAIEETKKRLLASLAEGQSMAQFIQSARANEIIQKGGFSKSTPWYWETVFRTNSIAAWNGGRFQQYREVSDSIQDLQYIAILDRRTSDVCRSYNGITRPATDTIWERITPPNHFNCRSTVTAIWRGTREAKRTVRSSDADIAGLPVPDDGFDSSIVSVKDFLTVPKKLQQKIFEYGLDDDIEKKKNQGKIDHQVYVGQGQYVKSIPYDTVKIGGNELKIYVENESFPNDKFILGSYGKVKKALSKLEKTFNDAALSTLKEINFFNIGNPMDEYWATRYNMEGFASFGTGGNGGINIWKVSEMANDIKDQFQWDHMVAHEAGHNIGQSFGDQMHPWSWGKFQEQEGWTSEYSKQAKSLSENFAESISQFMTDKAKHKKSFPKKHAYIKDFLSRKK